MWSACGLGRSYYSRHRLAFVNDSSIFGGTVASIETAAAMSGSKELGAVSASNDVTHDGSDSDSMGYSEYGTFPAANDAVHVNALLRNDARPMSERLRLIKTACMLGIYLGLVSFLSYIYV